METLYLILGIIILIIGIYDFFFTTLSGSGAGFISKNVSYYSYRVIHFLVRFSGRRMFSYSGLMVNLMVLAVWVLLIWLGLFLVFSSNPGAIINDSGRIANGWERLYYTGYVLSTLGIGNFKATTISFELLSSIFSFFGFIFFTSSITYFISVSSAVINKRTLARTISNFGVDPEGIAQTFLELDPAYSFRQLQVIQDLVDRHGVNHEGYPVIHFYSHPEPDLCLSINLSRLDEAFSILLNSDKAGNLQKEIKPVRLAITNFLNYIDKNFNRSLPKRKKAGKNLPLPYQIEGVEKDVLDHRRKILEGLLHSESFSWKDVVKKQAKKDQESTTT